MKMKKCKIVSYEEIIFVIIVLLIGMSISSSAFSINPQDPISINIGNIITVDDEGDGDYVCIQDAVDNASDGDTIYVYSGTYEETKIQKRITLKGIPYELENGNDSEKPVIAGHSDLGRLISLTDVHDCIIQGFNLIKGHHGLLLIDSSNNKISENNISHCYVGIEIENLLSNSTSNLIEKNNITDNNEAIVLEYVAANIIRRNLIAGSSEGITILGSHHNEISNNIFFDNGGYSIWGEPYGGGVCVYFSFNNIIKNNYFEGNTYGVFITASLYTIVRCNNFMSNKEQHASFSGLLSLTTIWRRNYLGRFRLLPKPIAGVFELIPDKPVSLLQFDWCPAIKPYEIL